MAAWHTPAPLSPPKPQGCNSCAPHNSRRRDPKGGLSKLPSPSITTSQLSRHPAIPRGYHPLPLNTTDRALSPNKHHHQENHPPPTPQLHPQPPILTMSQQEKISVYNLAGKPPPPHPLPPHPNLTPPPQSRPKKHNRRRHPQLPQLPLLPPIPHPLRRSPHPRLPRPPHRRRLLRLGLQARLRSDETPDRRGRRPLRRAQHRSHRVDLPRRARRRLRRNLPRRARARAHHERVGQGKGARV